MFASIRWFFGNYHVSIDVTVNEVTVNLEQFRIKRLGQIYASSHCPSNAHQTMLLRPYKDGIRAVLFSPSSDGHGTSRFPLFNFPVVGLDPNNVLGPPKSPSL